MMTEPRPPQGVRIVHADGSETPCEVTYDSYQEDSGHLWNISGYVDFTIGESIKVDMMPARTGIALNAKAPASGQFGIEWQDTGPATGVPRWWHSILRLKRGKKGRHEP